VASLLLEIGTEEIPAGYVEPAVEALGRSAGEGLDALRLGHGAVRMWATPRRLAILVVEVASVQRDLDEEVVGPPNRVAFDENGRPTAAALGFIRNQGATVDDLKVVETVRGLYVAVRKRQPGRPAVEVLKEEIPKWITGIPFPKSMRWRDLSLRFARPIHWILAVLDGEVIPFRMESLSSGRTTRGHRFLSPGEVKMEDPLAYPDLCRSAHVVVDPRERAEVILREATAAAASFGGELVEDPALLATLVHLVEYPVAVAGSFEREFLQLPREVLITSMREHQKFFGVQDARGRLMPHFVNIANIRSDSMDTIRKGNERVLRARLSDARFFFQADRRRTLEDRLKGLGGVIFHAKLGTSLAKVERIRALAVAIANVLETAKKAQVEEASCLCKADLTTDMVGEFPTLQGIMGREYARLEGKDPEVAEAIGEHYLPAFAGDRLPSGAVGAMVAIADKLDTIAGCFAVGDIPTGAGDPLGLRRGALGILHILLDRGYEMPLGDMVDLALNALRDKIHGSEDRVRSDILAFFRVRLENLWSSQGRTGSPVEAVLSAGFENVPEAYRRMVALESFMEAEGFEDLALSFKRVLNIVGDVAPGSVNPAWFQHAEEHDLLAVVAEAEAEVDAHLRGKAPLRALESLAKKKPRIDRFFDAVMVNVEDERLRMNRLAMLFRLGNVFLKLADFSKITGRA
jgi:glycyl-tRNA synthetase beta chain